MAIEDFATHRFGPTLGRLCGVRFEARHAVVNGVFFGFIVGLMREQPFSSTVLCPVIYRFPGQLRGSWSATPEGQRAKACLDAGGDAMDQEKMSQLMLDTWLGAGGVDGLLWRHICSTDGLTRCDSSSEQAMAVIKFAMSYAQLRGNHSSLAVTVVTRGLARWPLGGAREATRPPFHTSMARTHRA